MSKTYSWRVAEQSDFHKIYALIFNSKNSPKWNVDEIRRRVIIPLFLEQLISFYDEEDNFRGFLTFALMGEFSGSHQSTVGILPYDWRSGNQLWLVDLFCPFGDGPKMLAKIKGDVEDAIDYPMRYFRLKHKQVRRISL